ncbi:MAG: hypothetical protein IKD04_03425 [Clostridia bacterium]|nr:hypothetical protein [Clostridia bacterium]
MKNVKIIFSLVLIIALSFTIVFAFTNTYKQNRSGGYSSVCTLTEQDKEWIIENFSQYNTVEDLIVGINDYICKNYRYVDKNYIQHFDFAETVKSKSGLCFDFASMQKCIITVISEYNGWDTVKVYVADVETRTDAHSYNFICVGDKKYFSDPTTNLTRYKKGKKVVYYEDIGDLSFEEYANSYNEEIFNYH